MRWKNCVVVIIDCLRADRLKPWGGPIPFFEGSVARRCIAASGWTLLSIASILSGSTPARHGLHHHRERLRVPLLSQAFRRAGFRTGALVNNNNLDPAFGFSDGFDTYKNTPQEEHARVFEALPGLLKKFGSDPYFLVFHTNLVHDYGLDLPYYADPAGKEPLPPAGSKSWMSWPDAYHDVLRARYDRGISHCLHRLREEVLPQFDLNETLIAITSDHGEGLYAPRTYHAGRLHNDLLHVPLVILNDDWEDQGVFPQTGLLPALAARVGIETGWTRPEIVEAQDFAYAYRDDLPPGRNRIDYRTSPGLASQCWFDGRFKTIAVSSPVDGYFSLERYDIENDWNEEHNLAYRAPTPRAAEDLPVSRETWHENGMRIWSLAQEAMGDGRWPQARSLFEILETAYVSFLPSDSVRYFWLGLGICREVDGDYLGALTALEHLRPAESLEGADAISIEAELHRGICMGRANQREAALTALAALARELERRNGELAAGLLPIARLHLENVRNAAQEGDALPVAPSVVSASRNHSAEEPSISQIAEERLALLERVAAECEVLRAAAEERLAALLKTSAENEMLRRTAEERLELIKRLSARS